MWKMTKNAKIVWVVVLLAVGFCLPCKLFKNCSNNCSSNTYGFQCQDKCSDYCRDCNNIDGTCTSCTDGYSGKKCNIPPLPRFKHSPLVTNVGYTNVSVRVENFELTDHSINTEYKYFIQYKKSHSTNQTWISYKDYYDVHTPHTFIIHNLKPGVTYFVRSIITANEIIYEFGDDSHQTIFTTKCDVVKRSDFEINPSNTSAYLSILLHRQNNICELDTTELKVEIHPNIEKSTYKFVHMGIYLSNLTPFTKFVVTIISTNTNKNLFQIDVTTTEGVPEMVKKLKVTKVSNSEIGLTWEQPDFLHGVLLHYIITYQAIKHRGCDFLTSFPEQKVQSFKNSKTLSGLDSYTEYLIYVQAANIKFQGPAQILRANTSYTDNIDDKEIPKIISINPMSRSVKITFSVVTCNMLRGPLEVTITTICCDEWCNETERNVSFSYIRNKPIILSSLYPFTIYELKVTFCRKTCGSTFLHNTFKTTPEAPYTISNSTVYSKNENSISIRWKPPFPPTGNLELYRIVFYYENGNKESLNVSANSTCTLWPKYECFTLKKLKEKRNYTIEFSAKNKELEQFGQLFVIKALTKIEPSEQPPHLNIYWTLQNDLLIKWEHPTQANGDIKSFVLRIASSSANAKNVLHRFMNVTENQYKPVYQYMIKSTDIICSAFYNITVNAYNGKDGKKSSLTELTPPEIPVLETDPKIVHMTKNTILIQINKIKHILGLNTYKLFLLVSDRIPHSNTLTYPAKLQKFVDNFAKELNEFRVVYECGPITNTTQFVVGQINYYVNNCIHYSDPPLISGITYNIIVVLVSTHQNKSSYKIYPLASNSPLDNSFDLRLLALLLLLLVIPLAIVIYIYRHRWKKIFISSDTDDHISVAFSTASVDNFKNLHNLNLKSVPVEKFNKYVKTVIQNKKLEAQHKSILQNSGTEYEEIRDNTFWEHADIQFASGHRIPKVYIICNVPKEWYNFWKSVWNDKVEHIILFDNNHLQQFAKNYWPKYDLDLSNKNMSVRCIHEEIFADHEYRTFTITYQNETRVIDQLRFTAWYGFDLPHSLTFVTFFKKMSEISLKRNSPILVHCSAGLAGAGFAVLCDMCLRVAKKDNVIDIFKHSQNLGDISFALIDNYDCYRLAHLTILECLLSFNLNVKINVLDNKIELSALLQKESKKYFKYMMDSIWIDQLSDDRNSESNIYFQVDTPRYEGEILLKAYSPDEELDSYLSFLDGVVIDDKSCSQKYILTKQPAESTWENFWKLILKMKVVTIISLNPNFLFDTNLWTDKDNFSIGKELTLKLVDITHFKCYDWINLQVFSNERKIQKNVSIFSMKDRFSENLCFPNIVNFLEFCIETSSFQGASNPILVTCSDGWTASGLYVAMSHNLETIKKENTSDICTSTRLVRRYRNQFATKREQLKFLWEATELYIQQYNLYEIC